MIIIVDVLILMRETFFYYYFYEAFLYAFLPSVADTKEKIILYSLLCILVSSRYEGTVWDDLAHGKGVYIAEQGLVRFIL